MDRKKKKLIALWIGLAASFLLMLAAAASYLLWEKPPQLRAEPEPTEQAAEPEAEPSEQAAEPEPEPEPGAGSMPEGTAFETERKDGVYTILLVGLDQMSNSTDTLLVARFDTVKHELNLVSIPRDTITNIDSDIRKINCIYAGSINWGGNGIDALQRQISWLTGFVPDCYVILDLNTFIDIIDDLGGIDFYVPQEMEYFYDDIEKRLYVKLEPGMQHLDGKQAMAVCRYRIGYIDADYGRIEVQHEFLKACADQFISLGTIPHAQKIMETLEENLITNLSAPNIAWFMRQLLLCKSEDIHLYTMPSESRVLMGYSYVVPRLWEWLDMVNSCLNPYETKIEMWNMNLVYCDGSGYSGTQGYLDGEWYFEENAEG